MIKKKDISRIEKTEKKLTKKDLVLHNKLHALLKQIFTLESRDNVSLYDKIKAKEREVMKIINQIRKDTARELKFAQILSPKNKIQRAIVDIFGPFLSPTPASVETAEDAIYRLGVNELGVNDNGQSFLRVGQQTEDFGTPYSAGGDPHDLLGPNGFGAALARAEGLEPDSPEFSERAEYASASLGSALHGTPVEAAGEYISRARTQYKAESL